MIKLKDLLNERTVGLEFTVGSNWYSDNPIENEQSAVHMFKTILQFNDGIHGFKVVKSYNKGDNSHVLARVKTDLSDKELKKAADKRTKRGQSINII